MILRIKSNLFLLPSILAVLFFGFFILLSGPIVYQENVFRVLIGFNIIFLIPGLLFSRISGFVSESILENIAISFICSLVIDLCLMLLAIYYKWHIEIFCYLIITFSFICWCIVSVNRRKTILTDFMVTSSLFEFVMLGIFIVLSIVTFMWGDDPCAECLYHATFARRYFELPLKLENLGIEGGIPPQNIINMWEFLLAAWAKTSKVDILYVFFRARFIYPILGFSAAYFLFNGIFGKCTRTNYLFFVFFILCIGNFPFLDSYLDWVSYADRGVMGFMGTAHHLDASIDLMLPATLAVICYSLNMPNWKKSLLLLLILITSMTWHPRGFFISGMYMGIFMILIAVMPIEKGRRFALLKSLIIGLILFSLALLFFGGFNWILRALNEGKQLYIYDEMGNKKLAIHNAKEFWNQFNHFFFYFGHPRLHAIISAISVLVILVWGLLSEKILALFWVFLAFITTCSYFTYYLLEALTYTQFFMGNVWHFHIPSMVVTSVAFLIIVEKAFVYLISLRLLDLRKFDYFRLLITIIVFGVTSWGFARYASQGYPYLTQVAYVYALTLMVLIIDNYYYYSSKGSFLPFSPAKQTLINYEDARFFVFALTCLLLGFTPLLHENILNKFKLAKDFRRTFEFHSEKNQFGMSLEIIQYLKEIPNGALFYVNPLGKYPLTAYSAKFSTFHIPYCVDNDIPAMNLAREGFYPLFNKHPIEMTSLTKHLLDLKVDYILVEPDFYPILLPVFEKAADNFKVVFQNTTKQELIVQFVKI